MQIEWLLGKRARLQVAFGTDSGQHMLTVRFAGLAVLFPRNIGEPNKHFDMQFQQYAQIAITLSMCFYHATSVKGSKITTKETLSQGIPGDPNGIAQ